jgi:hypothetical protein
MIAVREKELGTSEGAGMSGRDRVAALLQLLGREHKVLLPRIFGSSRRRNLKMAKPKPPPYPKPPRPPPEPPRPQPGL